MKKRDVTVISIEGETALVEYGGERGYIPLDKIEDGQADSETLEMAAPYGVPWDKLLDPGKGFGKVIAAELRKRGIWTEADARNNHKVVQSILGSLLGLQLGAFYKKLNEYGRGLRS